MRRCETCERESFERCEKCRRREKFERFERWDRFERCERCERCERAEREVVGVMLSKEVNWQTRGNLEGLDFRFSCEATLCDFGLCWESLRIDRFPNRTDFTGLKFGPAEHDEASSIHSTTKM